MVVEYAKSEKKRLIQRSLIPLINKSKLVCLPGPDMMDYLSLFGNKFTHADLYEKDHVVMLEQVANVKYIPYMGVTWHLGDILDSKVDKDSFYDFDFCNTALTLNRESLRKYKDCQFMITFCLRGINIQNTLDVILDAVGEKKIINLPFKNSNLLTTNKSAYLWTTYKDHPHPTMINIFKL